MFEKLKRKSVIGAVAGNLALPGIKKGDRLIAVEVIDFTLVEGTPNVRTWAAPVDLTAEFTVTADDVINNAAGTSTANKLVQVLYEQQAGRFDLATPRGRSNY
jgi:hypothetical protein